MTVLIAVASAVVGAVIGLLVGANNPGLVKRQANQIKDTAKAEIKAKTGR